jgi:hypothetical protein
MLKTLLAIVAVVGLFVPAQAATNYTYTYNGPTFVGGADHVAVSFTTAAPLAPSTSYLDQAAAGVIASSVSVVGPNGPLVNFTLPVTTLQVHTDAAGAIDSWFVFGEFNTLTGTARRIRRIPLTGPGTDPRGKGTGTTTNMRAGMAYRICSAQLAQDSSVTLGEVRSSQTGE